MKCTRTVFLSLVLSLSTVVSTLASASEVPMVTINEFEAIAKSSIQEEVASVKAQVVNQQIPQGYPKRFFKKTLAQMGKRFIAPEYEFDKCIFTAKNVGAILSDTITLENDAVASKIGALLNLKTSFNRPYWKLMSMICVKAQSRFESRLKDIASHGVALKLDSKTIEGISNLMFYPTVYGKPSVKRAIIEAVKIILNGAVVIGTAGSFFGLPVFGIMISVVGIVSTSIAIDEAIPKPTQALKQKAIDPLIQLLQTDLDLNENECAYFK